ncbi:hypothetical protein [Methylomicrobium lacus]|uniref:hypothetical protein n=1 Tax=Methylomicrobium lacus TaxID=136992 RepID=UPI0035A896BB
MFKYLYLTEIEWADTWIGGGLIPIKLASTYLHPERNGVLTPDENLIHKSNVDIRSLSPGIHLDNIKNLNMSNVVINGRRVPDIQNASYYKEDGLILSFCDSENAAIAERLGKKCCVRVSKLKELKKAIDSQLGVKGTMGPCQYTTDHQRNHFLKSVEDAWQEEFRMLWKFPENVSVTIPGGHAKLVAKYT